MTFSLTLLIIVITCIISFIGFSNRDLINKLIFYPPAISQGNEWYRFVTHGLIHADMGHLFFNMFSFYSFGNAIENVFGALFPGKGGLVFLLFYISALVVSSIPTYLKHKNDSSYMSLGASRAISSVVFAFMIIAPTQKVGILFLPFDIPAFIFGFLYVILSAYMDKRGGGSINHSAHLYGALYGIVFVVAACELIGFPIISVFFQQVKGYFQPGATDPFK